jgi:Domain of unknown function (DUF6316)
MTAGAALMKRKSDDKERTVFRTDRFFRSDGKWFFTTREGGNLGPFDTHEDAERALVQHLLDMGVRPEEKGSWDTLGARN